jgi:hypothetical protein
MTKPIDALKAIARHVEAKKPKTLAEAEHMLDLQPATTFTSISGISIA